MYNSSLLQNNSDISRAEKVGTDNRSAEKRYHTLHGENPLILLVVNPSMDRFYLENRDPYAYLQLMIGLFFLAAGIVFILKSNLGMGPWSVFHVGITHHLPVTLGRVTQIVGLIVIIFSFLLNIYPGIGTILNMVFVGVFIDVVNPYVPPVDTHVHQITLLGCGIILVGLATGLYINANLGAGPRDGLMLGLSRKTGRSIRLVRNSIEVTVLCGGFILGGPVGVGTVVFALAIGPAVHFFLDIVPERGTTSPNHHR
jgi:uncharacterized membrane protein YczE